VEGLTSYIDRVVKVLENRRLIFSVPSVLKIPACSVSLSNTALRVARRQVHNFFPELGFSVCETDLIKMSLSLARTVIT
jgi:hypothetical protein